MLSVIVLAKNEEERITACLESVKWADELIVFDDDSTDKTKQIARRYTNKVYTVKSSDFAEIRNKAFEKAANDWVLYIDSDERVLENLRDEIKDLITTSDKSAFAISRKNIIFGQEVNYGPYKHDWIIRLFKKKDFKSWVGKVHEYATFNGELGYTKNSFLHLTHRSVDQFIQKSLSWSKIDASLRIAANHPPMNKWRFFRILISEFINQGVFRKGFFGGTVSAIDLSLQVFSFFITYVRVWEMQQKKPLGEVYDDIDSKLISQNFRYP